MTTNKSYLGRHLTSVALIFLFVALSAAVANCQEITKVTVFQQSASTDPQTIILEIAGTNLASQNEQPRVIVFPAVDSVKVISADPTVVRAQFTASEKYILKSIALSYANVTKSQDIKQTACDKDGEIVSDYNFLADHQVKEKYGNGVNKNFYVLQLSIVNKCTLPLVVPLAGIKISPAPGARTVCRGQKNSANSAKVRDEDGAQEPQPGGGMAEAADLAANRSMLGPNKSLVPYSLDHVTSVYSTDRKLTGARAIGFNIISALSTLGSGVQQFFGPGFTQGVSILGGGFTTAAQTIFKDMSAEQLQNITTQSFSNAEQIAPNGGSVNKFLFIPKKLDDQAMDCALQTRQVKLTFEPIVAITTAPPRESTPNSPAPQR